MGGEVVLLGVLDPDVVLDPDCQGADGKHLAAWVFSSRVPDTVTGPPGSGTALIRVGAMELILPSPSSMTETYRGRVVAMDFVVRHSMRVPLAVDERMGRFGGEFFAGAAVAAMGALVLALYLREWCVGRRATGRTR